jgi:hypothetical protein
MSIMPFPEAQACIDYCQRWHPALWRTTLDADSYRRCLDDACSGLPPSQGLPETNWPNDLLRAVGQDLGEAARTLQEAVRIDLLLLAMIVGGTYLIVRRVT